MGIPIQGKSIVNLLFRRSQVVIYRQIQLRREVTWNPRRLELLQALLTTDAFSRVFFRFISIE
ncbi:MAG: hypothetical protein C5B50_22130 [Verrucomicrobia bacterium]|nr:MAG: hypothetical protein C5B50_22130 [Verrucomicrobiota bacterium]